MADTAAPTNDFGLGGLTLDLSFLNPTPTGNGAGAPTGANASSSSSDASSAIGSALGAALPGIVTSIEDAIGIGPAADARKAAAAAAKKQQAQLALFAKIALAGAAIVAGIVIWRTW